MSKLQIFIVIAHLLFLHAGLLPNVAQGESLILNGKMPKHFTLVTSEPKKIGQVTIYIRRRSSDPGTICKPIMHPTKNELCSIEIGKDVRSISIEIQAPGYKRWTQNSLLNWGNSTIAFIDLAKFEPVPSLRPKVVHVKYNIENSEHVFDIAFYNPLDREILIKELTIRAEIPSYHNRERKVPIPEEYESNGCGEPPNEIFKISHKMTIFGKDDAGRFYATYQESTDRNHRYYQAAGTVVIDGCTGKGILVLVLSSMFYVAPLKHSLVRVIFPKQVTIKKRYYDAKKIIPEEDKELYSGLPSIENMNKGVVDMFNPWDFCFRTEDVNELEFGAKIEKLRPGFAKIIKNDVVSCRFPPSLQE